MKTTACKVLLPGRGLWAGQGVRDFICEREICSFMRSWGDVLRAETNLPLRWGNL